MGHWLNAGQYKLATPDPSNRIPGLVVSWSPEQRVSYFFNKARASGGLEIQRIKGAVGGEDCAV